MSEITYPPGCRPLSDDLGPDELIRRLKTLAHTLQAMGQDDGAYQQYIPLALHLVDDQFLNHPSRDVQLLIACCIADILRVYAPDAPYKDADQVKNIFLFLITQLSGLKDPKDAAFKRYFYLLENLAYVKSFNMCFELEDCQEIFCALFQTMFKIVNDEHSGRVKSFMLDVLCPLIIESDMVSNELLDIILMNIVEPNKLQRKNSYMLAKELILKTADTLEPYINAFYNHVLLLGKENKSLQICGKAYELIYELNYICPQILISVLPHLECKLKSAHESERLAAVALLARMFSEKESELARRHTSLWTAFLGRFNDISVTIRIKCVQYSMHFLINHPELRKDIIEALKLRQHDSEENVRYEVVMSIVSTARRDFQVVSESEDLLEFVKGRTLDKKFKIRKEAMSGLALIYKNHLNDPDVPNATKKAVTWIKDKILNGYYNPGMEDRLLVERLLNTCLVPYQLPAEQRMQKLYHLLGTVDHHATKAFMELQKNQLCVRKLVMEWLELHRRSIQNGDLHKEISAKVQVLSRCLPDPVKANEFLTKFSQNLHIDTRMLELMEMVVRPSVSCSECSDATASVLKRLGQPIMTNLYYNTVKMLLERISSLIIDQESIKILVGYVKDCLRGGNCIEEIGLDPTTAAMRGLKLLVMLSAVFASHFQTADVLQELMEFIKIDERSVPLVFSVFTFVGKYRCLEEQFPNLMNELAPICKEFAKFGTPKQSKMAIYCMFKNMPKLHDSLFSEVLVHIKENSSIVSSHYRTSIVALGHIAYNFPDQYKTQIKTIVSRKIVKEMLVKEDTDESKIIYSQNRTSFLASTSDWCRESELPEETRCKIEGIKAMARWLLGLKRDDASAQKTFRMLNAFIVHKGDLLQTCKLSKAEMSWLRLAAGCAMLKICEQKGVGDQYTAEQFFNLSQLMVDDVRQVREVFASKLHKGLSKGMPNKCLPLDFMGIYALVGRETDHKLKAIVRSYISIDISRRREYIKNVMMNGVVRGSGLITENDTISSTLPFRNLVHDKALSQLQFILPDYMLVFAITVLAHDPSFTRWDCVSDLVKAKQCLWYILEPLVIKNDNFSYGFYKTVIEQLKNHKDALKPDDDDINYKLWALCDLSTNLLLTKTSNYDMKDYATEIRIPTMYFAAQNDFMNSRIYLPPELQYQCTRKINLSLGMFNTSTGDSEIYSTNERKKTKTKKAVGCGPLGNDVEPSEASDTQIQLSLLEDVDLHEPSSKRIRD